MNKGKTQSRAYRIGPIIAFVFVTILFFKPKVSKSSVSADWIVIGSEIVENQTITLNGNLVIKPGGNLTLRNVTLSMNCLYHGQYRIEVEPGGSLLVENSQIQANSSYGYNFVINGSYFKMTDSEVHGAGWGPGQELGDENATLSGQYGMVVRTDNAELQRNTFSNNYVGVVLASSDVKLSNNTIVSNRVHGIFVKNGTNCLVSGNLIQHGGDVSSAIRMKPGHNNHIVGNTIEQLIYRGAIEAINSDGNLIEDNLITGYGVGLSIFFGSDDNVIRNNTISMNESGIMIWGWNNIFEGNTINDDAESPLSGIYLIEAWS